MAVISAVVSTASVKFFLVRLLLLIARRTAPSAPTPAASVGVAIPRRIDPSTGCKHYSPSSGNNCYLL